MSADNRPLATLVMTFGLPASGKSTWAEERVSQSNGRWVRVTKDQLRLMLNASKVGRGKRERNALIARDALVSAFLTAGVSVIVDDTNFNPRHRERLEALAASHDAGFEVQDFTHVPLAECIRRDAQRADSVGEAVIRGMWQQYLYTPPPAPTHDPSKPDAILVDLDGTLAIMGDRRPYEWHRVGEDTPNHAVIWMVRAAAKQGATVIYLSGRDGVCAPETQMWLDEHVGIPGPLHMRTPDDNRRDSIVKRELYDAHVRDHYNVLTVFDDRDQVVELWRTELGLPCFQVNYGAF